MSDRNSSRRRDRQSVGGLLQPPLQRGRRQSCWGLHSGGFDGQISELQQVWPSEDTTIVEGPPGLEETMPSQVSVGLSAASVVRDFVEDGGSWSCEQSCLQPVANINIPQAKHLLNLRKMGLVRPTSGVTTHWSMITNITETTDVSRIGPDWAKRREHSSGLSVADFSGSGVGGPVKGAETAEGRGFQLQRVPISLQGLL